MIKDMEAFSLPCVLYNKHLLMSCAVPYTESGPGILDWLRHEPYPLEWGTLLMKKQVKQAQRHV